MSIMTAQIEQSRLATLERILAYLNTILQGYTSGERQCREYKGQHVFCDALVLGDLIRELKAIRLFPIPEAASLEISVANLLKALRDMRPTSLCQINSPKKFTASSPASCVLQTRIYKELARLETQITGLRLPAIPPSAKRVDVNDSFHLSDDTEDLEQGSAEGDVSPVESIRRKRGFFW
jgi:hypothetical protein